LSNAELRARITNLEDTKKLYGSSQDAAIKALNGQVTDKYEDPDGTKHEVTYSKGNAAKLFGPAMRANGRTGRGRNVSPTRAGNSSGATEEDLERMERQMKRDAKKAEKEAYRQREAERKAMEREQRFALSKAGKQLADERRYNKRTAAYEKEQIKQAARDAMAEYRSRKRAERAIAREYDTRIANSSSDTVNNRVGNGTPYSPSSSVSESRPYEIPVPTWAYPAANAGRTHADSASRSNTNKKLKHKGRT
jgi:hypothetical protein